MLRQLRPPLAERCHCGAGPGVPDAPAMKVAARPTAIDSLRGCSTIAGATGTDGSIPAPPLCRRSGRAGAREPRTRTIGAASATSVAHVTPIVVGPVAPVDAPTPATHEMLPAPRCAPCDEGRRRGRSVTHPQPSGPTRAAPGPRGCRPRAWVMVRERAGRSHCARRAGRATREWGRREIAVACAHQLCRRCPNRSETARHGLDQGSIWLSPWLSPGAAAEPKWTPGSSATYALGQSCTVVRIGLRSAAALSPGAPRPRRSPPAPRAAARRPRSRPAPADRTRRTRRTPR